MKVFCCASLLVVAALSSTPLPGQAFGVMQELGTLGGAASEALGVSADGNVVVGSSETAGGVRHAFIWTPSGGMQDLGTLGAVSSIAHGVSADGTTVVGELQSPGGLRAFRWTAAGGMQDIGTFPGIPGSAAARATSANGAVVVGSALVFNFNAFRWTQASGMQNIDTFGGTASAALGINDAGSVVVGSASPPGSPPRAFRWTAATGMQNLGTLGGTWSEAYDLSASGTMVVGYSFVAGNAPRAFLWTSSTGMVNLGTLGGNGSRARAVSADGATIVGESEVTSSGALRAFIWTSSTGMRDLGTLGGSLAQACGVNHDGSVVVGMSLNVGGQARAFRWTSSELGDRYCAAVANSTGDHGLVVASGQSVVQANNVVLNAQRMPLNAFGFFLTSRDQGNTHPVNNSQGRLCLGGFIGRYVAPGQIKNSGAAGTFSLVIDIASMPQPFGNVAVQPGDTWNFQAWHRDANPTSTSNFTDAVSVTFN